MFVLGFNGSPRQKGNTDYLLSLFLDEAEKRGFETERINAAFQSYEPCVGCGHCERKGVCSIKDTLEDDLFPLIRRADIIVLASPVYFYSVPAKMKGIIDRIQTLWARKYRFDLRDPGADYRKGVLLCVGATKGKNLFDGIRLTAKYFFDGAGAEFYGDLCYARIDERGELKALPGVVAEVEHFSTKLLSLFESRKRILFACRENAGRSQIAAAFLRRVAGDRFDVLSGGSQPADKINPVVIEAMAEKGIDLAFQRPVSIQDALALGPGRPDMIVKMGCEDACPLIPGCKVLDWNLSDPAGKSIENVRSIRDEINDKIEILLQGDLSRI